MHSKLIAVLVGAGLLAAAGSGQAQAPAARSPSNQLVPTAAAPPVSTANVDLGNEFPQLEGYRFTQNFYTIAPGTGRAMHGHAGAPEIVRILSGTLTDSRNGGPPIAYGPGSTILNLKDTNHMWANLGTEPVVFIATSIKSPQPAGRATPNN